MKNIFVLALLLVLASHVQLANAFTIGGSVRGGGFGVGVSSDGSATVSGSSRHVGGSVHVDANSNDNSTQNNSMSNGSTQNASEPHHVYGEPIFEIDPADLPKYKGKTPKAYARLNGALIYSEIYYLYYNKVDKQIEIKTKDPDGYLRHSAMYDKDVIIKMPKGPCKLQNNEYICPK